MCEIVKEGLSTTMCPQRSKDKKDWCDGCRMWGVGHDNLSV